MAGLKSITDLPMAENTSGVNLIVNDNGVAKQADLSAVRAEQEYDIVFEYVGDYDAYFWNLNDFLPVSLEQCQNVVNKLKNKERVCGLLKFSYFSDYSCYCADLPLCFLYAPEANLVTAYTAMQFYLEGMVNQVFHFTFNETGLQYM